MSHPPFRFAMPKAVRITGRSSSITNSFVNGIVPIVHPSDEQIEGALAVLDMTDRVVCAYCGDPATEWDHLRPLVRGQQPTGYIHEIHNLVPACGKCNQSKGNKPWREWMFGPARLSPATRGIAGLGEKAAILERYEAWGEATKLDFAEIVGEELWERHWANHRRILEMMRESEQLAATIRARIAAHPGTMAPQVTSET